MGSTEYLGYERASWTPASSSFMWWRTLWLEASKCWVSSIGDKYKSIKSLEVLPLGHALDGEAEAQVPDQRADDFELEVL